MEVLVVLTVLGFLLAMVAPRLAGTSAQALAVTTRTNMDILTSMVTNSLQKTGKYPTGMINIVSVDNTTGAYSKPQISDLNPSTGLEVLGQAMDERHGLRIHYLNEAEAAELRALGVTHVYNYNSPFDRDVTVGQYMYKQPVQAGMAVLMTGGGATEGGTFEVSSQESDRAHPDELFRMVFGLGGDTSLIRDGMIYNAPTCAESGLDPINYAWKWYSLLLPRLKATQERLLVEDPLNSLGIIEPKGVLTAYAVHGKKSADQLNTAARRSEDVYARQHHSFFVLLDAEGATRPGVDMTGWGLDLNNNGAIE
jgi:hypothetical protein